MDDWRDFVVQVRRVQDLKGREHSFTVPPSWKTELQFWELFESFSASTSTLQDHLSNFDLVAAAVALVLGISLERVDDFSSEQIEGVFNEVFTHIIPNPTDVEVAVTQQKGKKKGQEFSLSDALAMFGSECGWLPADILEMPRKQVFLLAEAVTQYVAQKMKFQAAIHGADIEGGGAGTPGKAQIDSEEYWMNLQSQGLPVEVR